MAFDVITPVRMGSAELAISPALTTIRTTPALSRDLVKCIDVANNGVSAAMVYIYLVPSGGTADSSNLLVPGVSIPKNSLFQWTGTQVINSGATIQAKSSIAGVTAIVSGGEAV